MSQDQPPPPSYADAVRLPEGTSDPLISDDDIQGSGHNTPRQQTSGYNTPSRLSDSHHHTALSDSPHSSDDEETTRLKEELRKLREEKFRIRSDSNRQEQKKQLLKEALEREERDLRAATGYGPVQPAYGSVVPNPMGPFGPTAPPYNQMAPHAQYGGQNTQPGTVHHPTVIYSPAQGPGSTPYPSTSVQIAQTPTETPTDDKGVGCGKCAVCFSIVAIIVVISFVYIVVYN